MNPHHATAAARELLKIAEAAQDDPDDAALADRAAVALTVAAQAFGLTVVQAEPIQFGRAALTGTFPAGAASPR